MANGNEMQTTGTAQSIERELGIVEIQTDKGMLKLTPTIVRKFLIHGQSQNVTDAEIMMFLGLCRYQKLNPFLREVYLIKYGSDAQIVVGKETYTKRAFHAPEFKGYRAGVILYKAPKGEEPEHLRFEEGSFLLPGYDLVGGWAEVINERWQMPVKICVGLKEYLGLTRDGQVNRQWSTKPATMIRKVALVQALREAFPDDMGGMISEEEINLSDQLPANAVDTSPIIEIQGGAAEQAPAPANGTAQASAQEQPAEQKASKRMRKNRFEVDPQLHRGASQIITCGITPEQIVQLRGIAANPQALAFIKNFVKEETGYDDPTFLRPDEAEKLLKILAQYQQKEPVVLDPVPTDAPAGSLAPAQTNPVPEAKAPEAAVGQVGTERTLNCPNRGGELVTDSFCLNQCEDRRIDLFCVFRGESAPPLEL